MGRKGRQRTQAWGDPVSAKFAQQACMCKGQHAEVHTCPVLHPKISKQSLAHRDRSMWRLPNAQCAAVCRLSLSYLQTIVTHSFSCRNVSVPGCGDRPHLHDITFQKQNNLEFCTHQAPK